MRPGEADSRRQSMAPNRRLPVGYYGTSFGGHMIDEQERKRRRLKYRLVQLVLVMVTVGIGIAFLTSRRGVNFDADADVGRREVTIATEVPAASQLATGDMQL